HLAEADVLPFRVGGEELLELGGPGRARPAVALADDEQGDGRAHELPPARPVDCLEPRHVRAQPTNACPFCQSAPQRPPALSACTVRRISLGLRPTLRSFTDMARMTPLSSTITVARKAMPWSSFSTPKARLTAWFVSAMTGVVISCGNVFR